MVGFGSSLRLARRPGWEEAYLDYESLKLLLTQIEAIYEEEAHLEQRRQDGLDLDVMFIETADHRHHHNNNRRSHHHGGPEGTTTTVRDYRDDLFLESDSDAAFEALMKYDYYSAQEEASDLEQQQQEQQHLEMEQAIQWQQQYNQQQQQQQQSPRRNNDSNMDGNNSGNNNNNSIFTDRDSYANTTATNTFTLPSHPSQPQGHNQRIATSMASMGGFLDEDLYNEEDDDYDSEEDVSNTCVPTPWGQSKTKKKGKKNRNPMNNNAMGGIKQNQRRGTGTRGSSQFLSPVKGTESDFFLTTGTSGKAADAFILDANDDNAYDDDENADNTQEHRYRYQYQYQGLDGMSTLTSFASTQQNQLDTDRNSILQKPFRRTVPSNETTSLLVTATPSKGGGGSLYSFSSQNNPVTPPQKDTFQLAQAVTGRTARALQMPTIGAPTNTNNNNTPILPGAVRLKRFEEERKQERRKRRQNRRKRAENRKALERKVPQHIRNAHTKARDITERFLGLLRAECEKVMLFAQSRLGELADTAGSLRFSSMEDPQHPTYQHSSSSQYHGPTASGSSGGPGGYDSAPLSPTGSNRTPGSYDYPLSDGGMHPSASSSSVRVQVNGLNKYAVVLLI